MKLIINDRIKNIILFPYFYTTIIEFGEHIMIDIDIQMQELSDLPKGANYQ